MATATMDAKVTANQNIDLLVEGGYDAIVGRMRELTQCVAYLILDAHSHRRDPMDNLQVAESRLNADCAGLATDQILQVLTGFSPLPTATNADHSQQPDFDLAAGRPEALSNEEISASLDLMTEYWSEIDEAIYQLSMALSPTAQQLSLLYLELSRYRNLENAYRLALNLQLTPPTKTSTEAIDYFAVGETLAGLLASVLPVRCLPFVEQISLPVSPTPDLIIASYLASEMFMSEEYCFLFQNSDFNASATHDSRHCVLSAGMPFHDSNHLCFDHRAVDGAGSTASLLRDHLSAHSPPASALEFAAKLAGLCDDWVAGNGDGHLSSTLKLFWQNSTSDALAMSAAQMYLKSRYPSPKGLWLRGERA